MPVPLHIAPANEAAPKPARKKENKFECFTLTKDNIPKIGEHLWDLRTANQVTQEESAKRMKKIQSFVSHIEKPGRVPQLPTLVAYLATIGYKLQIVRDDKYKNHYRGEAEE